MNTDPVLHGLLWIGGIFAGFLVWWPIGVALTAAVTITAISQQIIGYRHAQPLPQPQVHPQYMGDITPPRDQIKVIDGEARLISDKLRSVAYKQGGQRRIGG